ncbi:MAG: polysaccharide pyruvyl transferase family protein [Bacteroidaceae bacterium]|nr:polysaccharide pyruvyl transferase family protein [Bacteroidaceae bacterium]
MKIGILSLPLHNNYGGILQAYALQKVLENMGHTVTIIDRTLTIKLPILTKYYRYAVRLVKNILLNSKLTVRYDKEYNYPIEFMRQHTYPFLLKHMSRLELHGDYVALDANKFDAIIVGSDQVWRPIYFWHAPLTDAYLSFAKDWDIKRISYAASFGTDVWEYTPEQTIECGALLRRFDAVSVRESSAVSLCNTHFGVVAEHVLDPTLLLDVSYYTALFQTAGTSSSEGDLMCYVLDPSDEKSALVRSVADTFNLTPFAVNSKYEDPNAPLEEKVQPPVEKWLRGFYDAKYVITDSFHACVFSILYQKPFVVYGNKHRGIARFHSLLAMFGLEDRLVTNPEDAQDVIARPIDWTYVNSQLTEWRKKSLNFLTSSLPLNL